MSKCFPVSAAVSISLGLAVAASMVDAQDTGAAPSREHSARIISIGNYPRVDGLRLNFRDRRLERVRGINVTIWQPYEPATGEVTGLALGLPMTGAGEVHGLAIGVLGASANGKIRGIALGGVGVGSGEGVRGLAVGGIGVGTGGDLTGIALAGIGAGAGGNVTGLTISGIGAGAGGTMCGIGIAGLGIGAPKLVGGYLAPMVGSLDAHAIVIAPVLFRIEKGGSFRGASLSSVNYVRGTQRGLSIGLVNYARTLRGVQIGVVNIIADQKSHPFLPIVNWGDGR